MRSGLLAPKTNGVNCFGNNFRSGLTVHDEKAVTALYEGGSSLYIERYLKAWLGSGGNVDGVYLCVDGCDAVYQRAVANPVDRARAVDISLDPNSR